MALPSIKPPKFLQNVVNKAKETVTNTVQTVTRTVQHAAQTVQSHVPPPPPVKDVFERAVDTAKHTVQSAVQTAQHTVQTAQNTVQTARTQVNNAVQTVQHRVNDAVQTAQHRVNDAVQTVQHQVNDAVQTVQHRVNDAVQTAQHRVEDVVHTVQTQVGQAVDHAVETAKHVGEVVADAAERTKGPMMVPIPDVKDFLKDAANKALDVAEKVVGKPLVDNVRPYVDHPEDVVLAAKMAASGVIVNVTNSLSEKFPSARVVAQMVDKAINTPPPDAPFPAADSLPITGNPVDGKGYQATQGPLWPENQGPTPQQDVRQGATLGDCYLMASLGSLSPEQAQNMVQDNKDGTYTVRLYDMKDGKAVPTFVRVTGELPTDPPMAGYGDSQKWVAIVEKAAAAHAGSYGAISGDQNTAYFATPTVVSGRPTVAYYAPITDPDVLYRRLDAATQDGRPSFVGTVNPAPGTYADHAYSVLGVHTDASGQRYVTLRNPWGNSEPAGNGPDDGIFEMKLEDFTKNFPFIAVAGG